MSQSLDLIVSAKNATDSAFKDLQAGLGSVDAQVKKVNPSMEAFAGMSQRARQAMEAQHEAALKMNEGLNTSDDQAQKLSATIGAMSTTVKNAGATFGVSATAFGITAQQLGAVGTAGDLAAVKLKGTAAGFNATSLAVAGAGLTIGAAIGTWLRTFPEVAQAADDAAAALYRLFQTQKELDEQANATQGLAAFQKQMAASNKEALDKQVAAMRTAGYTAQQILDTLRGKQQTAAKARDAELQQEIDGLKKVNEEAQRSADAAAKQAQAVQDSLGHAAVTLRGFWGQVPGYIEPAKVKVLDFSKTVVDLEAKNKAAEEAEKKRWEEIDKAVAAAIVTASNEQAWDMVAEAEHGLEASAEEARNLGDALHSVVDLLGVFGVDARSATGQLIEGLAGAAQGAATLMAGLASGNPAGIIGGIAGIAGAVRNLITGESGLGRIIGGAVVGGPLGAIGALLFGHGGPSAAERIAHDIMMVRTETINAAGGIDVLQRNAAAAGVSLDGLWNARTVAEYETAIARVNDAIAFHQTAVDKTKEAMERWGLTAADMGPKFAEGMLHEQLASIYQDLQLLEVGGADVAKLLAGPMGDSIQTLVQQSMAAGVALPEFMRPFIQTLIDSKDLVDANGNAITDVSQLNFTQDLSEQVRDMVAAVHDLADALRGIPREVDTLVKVTMVRTGGDEGGADGDPSTPYAEGGYFPYRPGGYTGRMTVGEAGDEAIIPMDKMAGIVAQAMAMAGGSGGGGGRGPDTLHLTVQFGPAQVAELVQSLIDHRMIRVAV